MYAQAHTSTILSILYMYNLFNPIDCSPPNSSVHGILEARILEWAVILLKGTFLTQRLKLPLLHLLHWQRDSLLLCHLGSPLYLLALVSGKRQLTKSFFFF